jgi:hypothetical protein
MMDVWTGRWVVSLHAEIRAWRFEPWPEMRIRSLLLLQLSPVAVVVVILEAVLLGGVACEDILVYNDCFVLLLTENRSLHFGG